MKSLCLRNLIIMNSLYNILITTISLFLFQSSSAQARKNHNAKSFDLDRDLLLVHYDCKTDVDDLQSVAAFATLLENPPYSKINYHAVAGAYGIQEGLYVPPNELFKLPFGKQWTDAHKNLERAVDRVKRIAESTLKNKGDIWIADAGQSDFSARLIMAIQEDLPNLDLKKRIHIVQHSDWNEEVTSPAYLNFVKANADYHKIPDGNARGNGTPGFRSPEFIKWKDQVKDSHLIEVWQLAIDLSNKYNGKEDRYLNEAISAGGLDFSDFSEVCWILGLDKIEDTEDFFELYAK